MSENPPGPLGNVITIDDERIKNYLDALQVVVDAKLMQAEREAAFGLHHVSIIDLSNLFCDRLTCPAIVRGVVAYYDQNHLSKNISLSLAPILSQKLALVLGAKSEAR